MSTQDDRNTVASVKARLERMASFGSIAQVGALVEQLIGIPAPRGNADGVAELAGQFGSTANNLDTAQLAAQTTSQNVPNVWVGAAAAHATDVMLAVCKDLDRSVDIYRGAKIILDRLADAFTEASTTHSHALDALFRARDTAASGEFRRARDIAIDAADQLLRAFDTAIEAQTTTGRDLDKLSSEARAVHLSGGNLTSADILILASASDPQDPSNRILTQTDAQRAVQRLATLPPHDRSEFLTMLAQAKSPEHRAYLAKQLATGNDFVVTRVFADRIASHGDDPKWLRDHLSPEAILGHTPDGVDSAALATVYGHGSVDPYHMLHLTTGFEVDNPDADNHEAIQQRVRDEVQRIDRPGVDATKMANGEIGVYTGTTYEHRAAGPAERVDVLRELEHAVDQGRPVLVTTDHGGHAVITGHFGHLLEVYTPGNGVVLMTESDFASGRLPGATGAISGVNMPR